VEQHVYFVEKPKKKFIISLNQSRPVWCLVFSRTKHGADNVVKHAKTVLQLRPYMVINLRMQDSRCRSF
jgi:hypothetical protein